MYVHKASLRREFTRFGFSAFVAQILPFLVNKPTYLHFLSSSGHQIANLRIEQAAQILNFSLLGQVPLYSPVYPVTW